MKRKLAIISGIVLLVAVTYTVTSTLACASDEKYCQEISATPTLPIPTDEYLPNITPTTVENEPTVTCEGGDTYSVRQECMETTPTIQPSITYGLNLTPTIKPTNTPVATSTPTPEVKSEIAGSSAAVIPTGVPATGRGQL